MSLYIVLSLMLIRACNTQASDMTVLTSNLSSDNFAYDGQVVSFQCITRGTILVWQSDDYIGPVSDGQDLRLTYVDSPGHTEPSSLVSGTIASLASVADINGGTVIESELQIRASLLVNSISSVTCANLGGTCSKTIIFRVVPTVLTLTSNLTRDNLAYDGQVIVFRCMASDLTLVWQSDDYIGPVADGQDLRLTFIDSVGHTEHSSLVDGTVARVVNTTDDINGTFVVSELEIRASLNQENSSVTCTSNGLGIRRTIYFRVVEIPTTATPVTEIRGTTIDETLDSNTGVRESVFDSDVGVVVGVAVSVVAVIISIATITVTIIFFVKCKETLKISRTFDMKEEKGRPKRQNIDQGTSDDPTCIPVTDPGPQGSEHEGDPDNSGRRGLPGTGSTQFLAPERESTPTSTPQSNVESGSISKAEEPDTEIGATSTPQPPGSIPRQPDVKAFTPQPLGFTTQQPKTDFELLDSDSEIDISTSSAPSSLEIMLPLESDPDYNPTTNPPDTKPEKQIAIDIIEEGTDNEARITILQTKSDDEQPKQVVIHMLDI